MRSRSLHSARFVSFYFPPLSKMKKLPLIVLIAWILVLSWCQAPLIETTKSAKNQTFDCSQPHYYEHLKLNKKVSFARDETAQNYQLTIPELCLKLTAYPDDQVPLQDWKKAVQADAAHGFLVKNNALESQNYQSLSHKRQKSWPRPRYRCTVRLSDQNLSKPWDQRTKVLYYHFRWESSRKGSLKSSSASNSSK